MTSMATTLLLLLHGAADDPAELLRKAAQSLGARRSYAWTATTETADAGDPEQQFGMGPIEGSTEKDGPSRLKTVLASTQTLEGAWIRDRRIARTDHFDWEKAQGGKKNQGSTPEFYRRFLIGHLTHEAATPATELESLLPELRDLRPEGSGGVAAALTEKAVLDLSRRGPGPTIEAKAEGTISVRLKDGLPEKIVLTLRGVRDYGRVAVNRSTTIVIKDVDSARVELPEEAKRLLKASD